MPAEDGASEGELAAPAELDALAELDAARTAVRAPGEVPARLGDMDVVIGPGDRVLLRRHVRWIFLLPYGLVGALLGYLVYYAFADPSIAYLPRGPAAVLGVLAGLASWLVSAYGGLGPRWIVFDGAARTVRARGHDAFAFGAAEVAQLAVEWMRADPGPDVRGRPRPPELRAELLVCPRGAELEPFAEARAPLGDEAAGERLRAEVTALVSLLARTLGVPAVQLERREDEDGSR